MGKIVLWLFVSLWVIVFLGWQLSTFTQKKLPELPLISFSKPTPTPTPKPPEYSAWYAYWNTPQALESFNNSGDRLKVVSGFSYIIGANGRISQKTTPEMEQLLQNAQNAGRKLLPSITNEFDPTKATLLITESPLQDEQTDFLIQEAQKKNYQGWDVDLEEVNLEEKDKYEAFIKKFSQKLKQNNLLLSVTVHPREGKDSDRRSARTQDYKVLSESVDFIRVMAYDFHHATSDPGPVTPLSRYKAVLEYASKAVPLEKLVIGLPLYGYEWGREKGVAVTYTKALEILTSNQVGYTRDPDSKALTAQYQIEGKDYEMWFEDTESVQAKINLAQEYGVYQFCFWKLGEEDRTLWQKLP